MAREIATSDDLSPIIEVIVWIMFTFTALTVITRLGIKLRVLKKTNADDATILASLVFATVQSILVSVASSHGAGTTVNSLSSDEVDVQEKTLYASDIFFVLSCFCAKVSLVNFIRNLGASQATRRFADSLLYLFVLWAVSSILAIAFECGVPRPWAFTTSTCSSQRPIQVYVGVLNIFTDLILVVWPLSLVAGVQIPFKKRISVSLAFLGRLSVVAAVVCQVVFRYTAVDRENVSLTYTPVVLSTQIAQCLSIASTCAIYLKPFLDSLESGFINVGDLRRRQSEGFGYSPRKFQIANTLRSISGRVRGETGRSRETKTQTRKTSTIDELIESTTDDGIAMHETARNLDGNKSLTHEDGIVETREWTVDYSQQSRKGSRG